MARARTTRVALARCHERSSVRSRHPAERARVGRLPGAGWQATATRSDVALAVCEPARRIRSLGQPGTQSHCTESTAIVAISGPAIAVRQHYDASAMRCVSRHDRGASRRAAALDVVLCCEACARIELGSVVDSVRPLVTSRPRARASISSCAWRTGPSASGFRSGATDEWAYRRSNRDEGVHRGG